MDSPMIEVAKIHARDHQPLLPPAAASVIPVCRAWHCNESWPCPVRRNAVTVLWFYGINPASVDDPPRQPLPDTGPARRPRPHLPTATQDSLSCRRLPGHDYDRRERPQWRWT
ncbi:hypothetical protein GCM10009765_12670 [Fodinicola feengrottensis]|uniref:Uncharacterized protein n=1 Tax=Fodinicola feengrottensis TaxID=435914 RepID=A0ABN2G3C2_9ACTN